MPKNRIIRGKPQIEYDSMGRPIEEAEEIHCMESSMKSLIDLYAKTDNIFYHDFRNQPIGNLTHKKWNVIKYD